MSFSVPLLTGFKKEVKAAKNPCELCDGNKVYIIKTVKKPTTGIATLSSDSRKVKYHTFHDLLEF
jgi:hypothetical protein